MIKCYGYFKCDQTDCIARQSDKPCWELKKENVFNEVVTELRTELKDQLEACKLCIYYCQFKSTRAIFYYK